VDTYMRGQLAAVPSALYRERYPALKSLDASVALNITDNIALTFDGLNLTDEKIVQFADNRSRPRAIYDNGRVYYAGAKLRF